MRKDFIIIPAFLLLTLLLGCIEDNPGTVGENLVDVVQVPDIQTSVERQNIVNKLEITNDPSTIMWIYLLSDNGDPIFFGPVVGKVTSGGKRLEPINAIASGDYARVPNYKDYEVSEIAQVDGTYGNSDSYIFWFDPEGNFYQWSGKYFVSSIPLKLQRAVLIVRST